MNLPKAWDSLLEEPLLAAQRWSWDNTLMLRTVWVDQINVKQGLQAMKTNLSACL